MLTLKQAFEDLHDRMQKQLAETMWEIERVKGIAEKTEEWYNFAGTGTVKEKILSQLEKKLKERKKNLEMLEKILKRNVEKCQ